jgi:hypothetical protein
LINGEKEWRREQKKRSGRRAKEERKKGEHMIIHWARVLRF